MWNRTEKILLSLVIVLIIGLIVLSVCLFTAYDRLAVKNETLTDTLNLLDKTLNRANEYKAHSEEMEKIANDAMKQIDILKKAAEIALETAKEAQEQNKILIGEVEYYQEHVAQYLAVIQWYEKILNKDPNLPEK